MTNIIEIRSLSYRYPNGQKKAQDASPLGRPALDQISFTVKTGEIFGLLGPNGGGKTTLFKILSTRLNPNSGSVSISGHSLTSSAEKVRPTLGIVFQSPSLDKKLTVTENMTHQGHLYGERGHVLQEKIQTLLDQFHLSDRSRDLVETLSGGLARRLEIAKSLIHGPKILLMDEPSTGLDPGSRRSLWDQLQILKSNGITIILTTHLMDEAEHCDRLAILNEGKLVALDTPNHLTREIGGEVITIQSEDPKTLSTKIEKKFSLKFKQVGNRLRIEKEKGAEWIPEMLKTFPKEILSIKVSQPTLEDVFIHHTGNPFWSTPEDPS